MSHLTILVLFLPAFTANAAPVVIRWFPLLREWNIPVWERMLGKNKTWRGWIGGTVIGMCTGLILWRIAPHATFLLPLYDTPLRGMWTGGMLGMGALVGDMVKSAVKRRLHVAPGSAFPPWDGVDYMIGAMLFALPFYRPDGIAIVILLVAGPVFSLLANMCSYALGWKNVWY